MSATSGFFLGVRNKIEMSSLSCRLLMLVNTRDIFFIQVSRQYYLHALHVVFDTEYFAPILYFTYFTIVA